MKYDDLRDTLKTGDILLFGGKGAISDGIKLFTLSKWSHVGMVYRINDDEKDNDIVFCWESTTLANINDAETGKLTKGVQLVILSERLERCFAKGYEISHRSLNKNITDDMLRSLKNFRKEVSGRPYEKNKLELIKAAYDGWLGDNKENLSSLFCSELVAEAYQRMGLLPEVGSAHKVKPSNEYTPADFSVEKRLSLLNDYSLGQEIMIDSFE